jgi:hypothetical protein
MTDTPAAPAPGGATAAAAAATPGRETMPISAGEAAANAAAAAAALAAASPPKPAMTREVAKAELNKLKDNAEFRGKLLSGDAAAKAQWAELIKNSSQAPDAAADEAARTKGLTSDIALLQAAGIDLTSPAGQDLVSLLGGKEISIETRRAAEGKRAILKKDQAFVAKWLQGDAEAKRTMTTLNVLLTAKVSAA